jgi:hypothetical protein
MDDSDSGLKTKILMIILLFLFIEIPNKPKFIKKFTYDNPIYKWFLLFFILLKKDDGPLYYLVIFGIYQVLHVIDMVYFE